MTRRSIGVKYGLSGPLMPYLRSLEQRLSPDALAEGQRQPLPGHQIGIVQLALHRARVEAQTFRARETALIRGRFLAAVQGVQPRAVVLEHVHRRGAAIIAQAGE